MPRGVHYIDHGRDNLEALLAGGERVCILSFDNSNGAHAAVTQVGGSQETNTGWDHGVPWALTRLGCKAYSTGLVPPRNWDVDQGRGLGMGWTHVQWAFTTFDNAAGSLTFAGATNFTNPPIFVKGADPTDPTPHHLVGMWTGPGNPTIDNNFRGIKILTDAEAATGRPAGLMDYDTADLRANYFWFRSPGSGSQAFNAGFAVYPNGGGINNLDVKTMDCKSAGTWAGSAAAYNIGHGTCILPAGSAARNAAQVGAHFPLYGAGGGAVQGDRLLILGANVEQVNRVGGFAYKTVTWANGYGARRIAQRLQDASNNAALDFMIAHSRHMQQGNPGGRVRIIFRWDLAVNDVGDGANSVGPSPAPSNTAAGAYDNCRACVAAIDAALDRLGIPRTWVTHIWEPAHWYNANPDVATEAAALALIRQGVKDFCRDESRSVFVNKAEISYYEEHRSAVQGVLAYWTAAGTEPAHLTRIGYESLSLRVWAAIFGALSSQPARLLREMLR